MICPPHDYGSSVCKICGEPKPSVDMQEMTWICISAHRKYGHWEYLFNDPVVQSHLQEYLEDIIKMGAERFTLHKFLPLGEAMNSPYPHTNLDSYKPLKLTKKLDEFNV